MRISDWSSCVCSSDLPPIPGASPVTDSLCISPVDNREYARRPVASDDRIEAAFVRARQAQRDWARLSIAERAGCCTALVDAMLALREEIVPELAWQMGRPVKFGVGDVRGFEQRARARTAPPAAARATGRPADGGSLPRSLRPVPPWVVLHTR